MQVPARFETNVTLASYMASFGTGVLFVSVFFFVLNYMIKCRLPNMEHMKLMLIPGLAGGVIWTIGNLFSTIATLSPLGLTIGLFTFLFVENYLNIEFENSKIINNRFPIDTILSSFGNRLVCCIWWIEQSNRIGTIRSFCYHFLASRCLFVGTFRKSLKQHQFFFVFLFKK